MSETGWWTCAKVGDKVVCIRDDIASHSIWGFRFDLVKGQVYTIAALLPNHGLAPTGFAIKLVEPNRFYYDVSLFKPVQTKSTEAGMSVFKEILNRGTVPVSEPVKSDA